MIVDAALLNRLERSAAALTVATVEAMRRRRPDGHATADAFGGGALVATGPGGYVNRVVGLGDAPITTEEMDVFETFFADRGLPPSIEVSSWASSSLMDLLRERQYRPDWFRNVYVREASALMADESEPQDRAAAEIVAVDGNRVPAWLDVLDQGVTDKSPAARAVSDEFGLARFAIPGGRSFLALIDGEPAGCGSIEIADRIGWCGGAASVGRFRRRGVQSALLRHRIATAVAAGCDLIAATAVPTGSSARNLNRHGFALAYTQLVMTRPTPSSGGPHRSTR